MSYHTSPPKPITLPAMPFDVPPEQPPLTSASRVRLNVGSSNTGSAANLSKRPSLDDLVYNRGLSYAIEGEPK